MVHGCGPTPCWRWSTPTTVAPSFVSRLATASAIGAGRAGDNANLVLEPHGVGHRRLAFHSARPAGRSVDTDNYATCSDVRQSYRPPRLTSLQSTKRGESSARRHRGLLQNCHRRRAGHSVRRGARDLLSPQRAHRLPGSTEEPGVARRATHRGRGRRMRARRGIPSGRILRDATSPGSPWESDRGAGEHLLRASGPRIPIGDPLRDD